MPPYEATLVPALVSLVVYVILCWAASLVVAVSRTQWKLDEATEESRRTGNPVGQAFKVRNHLKRVAIFGISFVIGAGVVNALSFGAAHLYDGHSDPIRATDVAHAFGLESGKQYPLILGDRIGGTSGSVSSGFFTSVNLKPGSSVSVGFVHENTSYILEIPVGRSTFLQNENATPTVTLHLNPVESYDYGKMRVDAHRPCNAVIRTAILHCRRIIISTPQLNEQTTRRGLAALVTDEDVLDSATFVVTPTMYSQIMTGKNG